MANDPQDQGTILIATMEKVLQPYTESVAAVARAVNVLNQQQHAILILLRALISTHPDPVRLGTAFDASVKAADESMPHDVIDEIFVWQALVNEMRDDIEKARRKRRRRGNS